ncbi:C40 family peptidase [Glycomyces salinus]|uniref:C40 family peptidase n=1 Tax=Glycomyces salinus TaxID=980294 RepID=UPI0018EC07C6|nr:C40 family peptidase [Glycomyces salinus]
MYAGVSAAAIGAATVFIASPAEAEDIDYDEASAAEIEDHLEDLEADRDEAADRLTGLEDRLAEAQAVVDEASAVYGSAEVQLDQVTFAVDSAEPDLGSKMTSLVDFAREQSDQYGQAQEALALAERLEGLIEEAEQAVADLDDQIDEAEQAVEEAEEAEAEAAAEAEAEAEAESGSDASGSSSGSSTPSYSSDAATAAVQFVHDQLGEPYVFGAAGPDTWDCSGLIQGAYAVSGISLTHSTYVMWDETSAISRDDLRPGDLVFYNGLGHMAMYIGGGEVIHAPSTGDVVKVSGIDMMGIDGYRRV